MNKRLVLIILALALFGGGYVVYRNQDKQIIGRQTDQFLENIEHKKISLRKESDVRSSLSEVLAPEINLLGATPIPTGGLSGEEVIQQILNLHNWTSLCEIKERSREITVNGNEARVTIVANVHVAVGKNIQRREEWTLQFKFGKTDTWRVDGIKGAPSSGRSAAEEASDFF